jgi:hypothetical protein
MNLAAAGAAWAQQPAGGSVTLSGDQGQAYHEYDLTPYTSRVLSTKRPEQAVVDWVLRETGYEEWHSDVVSFLCVHKDTAGDKISAKLKVYHTREVHNVVSGVVSRFVNNVADSRAFALRVISLDEPDWRARAYRVLKPLPVQTQGVGAWMLEREQAAMLLAELAKRYDYREPPEHNAQPTIENGQSHVIATVRSTSYFRDVAAQRPGVPGLQPVPDQMNEGLALEFSPLLSADGRLIDAVLKCHIDQVESLRSVAIEQAPGQTGRIDVPQVSQFRLQERFRWPVDQVLLISLGMVPTPQKVAQQPLSINSLRKLSLGSSGPSRADVLIFVECKGKHAQTPVVRNAKLPPPVPTSYHHRY